MLFVWTHEALLVLFFSLFLPHSGGRKRLGERLRGEQLPAGFKPRRTLFYLFLFKYQGLLWDRGLTWGGPDRRSRLGEEPSNSDQAVTGKACKQVISLQLILYRECRPLRGYTERLWAGVSCQKMELTPQGWQRAGCAALWAPQWSVPQGPPAKGSEQNFGGRGWQHWLLSRSRQV